MIFRRCPGGFSATCVRPTRGHVWRCSQSPLDLARAGDTRAQMKMVYVPPLSEAWMCCWMTGVVVTAVITSAVWLPSGVMATSEVSEHYPRFCLSGRGELLQIRHVLQLAADGLVRAVVDGPVSYPRDRLGRGRSRWAIPVDGRRCVHHDADTVGASPSARTVIRAHCEVDGAADADVDAAVLDLGSPSTAAVGGRSCPARTAKQYAGGDRARPIRPADLVQQCQNHHGRIR